MVLRRVLLQIKTKSALLFCAFAMGSLPIAPAAAESAQPVSALPHPLAEVLQNSIAGMKITNVSRAGNLTQISLREGEEDHCQLKLWSAHSVDEATKIFEEVAESIPVAPFEGILPMGDQVRAWRSQGPKGGGTILFRNGTVVGTVEGTGRWDLLVHKAQILNEDIGVSPAKFDLALKVSPIPDALQSGQAALAKTVVPATALIQKLAAATEDKDRAKLILEIMNSGDRAAVPVLITQLDAKYPMLIRTQAMKALGKLGDPAARNPLMAILQQPVTGDVKNEDKSREPMERRSAISALEDLGDPSVIPLLKQIAANEQEYPSVRERAQSALSALEAKQK